MLRSLPDRPLYDQEWSSLNDSDAVTFAFPAVPDSLQQDEEGREQIHDLMLFIEDSVVAISYDEDQEGWIVVAKEEGDDPYNEVFHQLIEYRGYVDEQEELIRELGRQFYRVAREADEMELEEFEEEIE